MIDDPTMAAPGMSGDSAKKPRDRIIDALLALAADRSFEDITLTDIAETAHVSLADFRDAFPSKGAVLGGFARRIDRIVLDGHTKDLIDEPAKERLFDVLMRRLDAMAPYKAGLKSVAAWARREPLAAAALNRGAVNSLRFMLEAAGITSEGALGAAKLQGLSLAWGRILTVWFDDDDAGLAPTMAAMDKELTRGGQIVGPAGRCRPHARPAARDRAFDPGPPAARVRSHARPLDAGR